MEEKGIPRSEAMIFHLPNYSEELNEDILPRISTQTENLRGPS